MKVYDILTPDAEVIHPDACLCEAAQKMERRDIGMLPVCDGERLIGALTDRDIVVRAVGKGYDPVHTHVKDVMTSRIRYCFENDDVERAAQIMEDHQIRRLPVINSAKRLVGMISLGDLAMRTHDEQLVEEVMEHICVPV
ncbi:MAG TPA: CBS domain-containing protein [Candidatus Acidoferrum sp.]|nr:CBS domain-containing protein [Candidatus Acidoferrum sp.]